MISRATARSALRTDPALARAGVYGLLACLFSYPDARTCARISSGEMNDLLCCLPFAVAAVPVPAEALNEADLAAEYLRLFELPGEHGSCVLFGGCYEKNRQAAMEELLRFYRHFGLTIDGAQARDMPDSLPTVLEFMQFLCVNESRGGDAASARSAQRDLLARHLTRWAPGMKVQLRTMSPEPVYACTLEMMNNFFSADLEYLSSVFEVPID